MPFPAFSSLFQTNKSSVTRIHLFLVTLLIWPLYLVYDLRLLSLPALDLYWVTFLLYLSSALFVSCSAQCHFKFTIGRAKNSTFLMFLILAFGFFPRRCKSSMVLSMFLLHLLGLSIVVFFSVRVSEAYWKTMHYKNWRKFYLSLLLELVVTSCFLYSWLKKYWLILLLRNLSYWN